MRDGRLREPARKAAPIPGPSITGRRWREGASEAPQNHHHTKESCDENLQLSFFIWEVVAGTVKIDFDAREAKPGSKGLRNHGTKFRISPDDICRIYAKKERFC